VEAGSGGRGSGYSGEPAVKPRQEASVEDPKGPREGSSSFGCRRRGPEDGARRVGYPWRGGSGSAMAQYARGGDWPAFIGKQGGGGVALCAKAQGPRYGGAARPRYDSGAVGRAARSARHNPCVRGA
jgi:hypothetical protein